jgi:hypothetical protein
MNEAGLPVGLSSSGEVQPGDDRADDQEVPRSTA